MAVHQKLLMCLILYLFREHRVATYSLFFLLINDLFRYIGKIKKVKWEVQYR